MTTVAGQLHLQLDADRASIQRLADAVEEFGLEQSWPPKLLFQTQLVLEELVTNVIDYGFQEGGGQVEVQILSSPESVTIDVTDDAWEFNPLSEATGPRLDAALEDRLIGGVGLHLVRAMMDELRYARKDGKNHLVLIKRRDE